MAYYDPLIEAWNNPIQPPPGVTGEPLLAPDTTDEKIVKINAWTVTGTIPMSINIAGVELANCINFDEFAVLTPEQQSNVLGLCAIPGALLGGMGNTDLITAGMFVAYFPLDGPTIANLTELAKAQPVLWWVANGYTSPIGIGDVQAAGLE